MENKTLRIINAIIKWLTATVIIITLSVTSVKCLNIYSGGNGIYSRDAVASAVSDISPLLYLCGIIIIGGFIVSFFAPADKKKFLRVDSYVLMSYKSRYALNDIKAKREEKLRCILKTLFSVLSFGILIFPLIYLLEKDNFTVENLNSDIISAVIAVSVPTAVVFALFLICVYLCNASIKREINIYKNAVAANEAMKIENSERRKSNLLVYVRIGLISIAVVLIVLGIFNDGIGDVYGKAVRICTECIGLG